MKQKYKMNNKNKNNLYLYIIFRIINLNFCKAKIQYQNGKIKEYKKNKINVI